MTKYLMGCDIGTGGTKSVLIDTRGRVVGSHYAEYGLLTPRPGRAEQPPDWYWNATVETMRESIKRSGVDARDIVAVGLSAQSPGCIAVDERLQPLRNCDIWMDRRAQQECAWIRQTMGEERVFAASANPIDPYFALPKWMWLRNNEPETYAKTYKLLNQKDYPLLRLTGVAVTDHCNAALGGIAYDIRRRDWDRAMVRALGMDIEKFPASRPCDEVVGSVTAEAAALTGLREGTPVVAGTVDAAAGWLSMGVIEDGENALTLGTAACWGVIHEAPAFTPGMISLPHAAYSGRKYASCAAMVGGAAQLRWFRDVLGPTERRCARDLGVSAYDIMNVEAEQVAAGCDGLMILPYFMGERTPVWDVDARGVLFGLSFAHGRGHMIRAMMESVAFGIRHNIELVKRNGVLVHPVMGLVEGGARSRLWRQIMADVVGMDVVYMSNIQGAPVGDALVAGVGVGAFQSYEVIKDWVAVSASHQPQPAMHEFYTSLFKVYLSLYPSLRERFTEMARVMDGR